jgi:proteasome lid subunit RPN8/RPN11
MKPLTLSEEARAVMAQDAVGSFPDECCGFLFGAEDAVRRVTLARPVDNSKEGDRRRRFEISPDDYRRAELFAVQNDLTLLGVYHSHPLHPAIASEHDRLAALPWFSYVILSVFGDEIRDVKSWQLDDERRFHEEHILSNQPE